MPPRPIVNDALWRCLCPRYQSVVVSRSATRESAPNAYRDAPSRRVASSGTRQQQRRAYNTPSVDPFSSSIASLFPPNHAASRQRPRDAREKLSLVHVPTPHLYEHLRAQAAKGRHEEAMKTIKILIKDRRERPNKEMYTAILHSFVSSTEGTAGKVRKVLEEMEVAGIALDSRGCECVLEALSVHPDYLLRVEVLAYMKTRWFTLSDRAHNFLVAGLLRDRLFEQALEKLEEMMKHGTRVDDWLWDKTLWMLLEFEEVDEAFYVLNLRQSYVGAERDVRMSEALWGALLDAAGKRHLHQAASMVWSARVIPGYLKPTTGTCLNLLSICSRTGDVGLATDIFRVLTSRETVFNTHHYEFLIQTYMVAKDLTAALSVLLIMADSGLRVTAETVHPLYTYLSKDASRPMQAFTALQDLEAQGQKIPTSVVNACIQASIHLSKLDQAIEIYKALHTVCKAGPNTQTFNMLFQGCHQACRKELALFLANEMISLNLRPDRLTYDRLVLVCLTASDITDAMLYYEEMKNSGLQPRRGTYNHLISKAVEVGDARAVVVLRDYQESGEVVDRRVERAVREKFQDGADVDL